MQSTFVLAENASEKFICKTNGVPYTPDVVKHRYGHSARKPLEDWFLDELKFFHASFPKHRIFTLGSSMVFGERFVTYLTVCQMGLKADTGAFDSVVSAMKASDLAIRAKLSPLWKWDMGAVDDDYPDRDAHANIVMIVGWLDFAYFLQHRQDFLDKSHTHHMRGFIADQGAIKSTDYKLLQDGSIVRFDPEKLSDADATVFNNYQSIQFERLRGETLV